MSWASENPELHDKLLIRRGILNFIENHMTAYGFTVPGEWREGYEALIETIMTDPQLSKLYSKLADMATVEIIHAEQDYWGSLIDQAKERFDEN